MVCFAQIYLSGIIAVRAGLCRWLLDKRRLCAQSSQWLLGGSFLKSSCQTVFSKQTHLLFSASAASKNMAVCQAAKSFLQQTEKVGYKLLKWEGREYCTQY